MRSTQNGPGSSGFTLVELLIVLAIFGVLMGMIFSSLTEGQNASVIARDEAEMQQNLQDVLALMTSEMRTIGFPPASYYDQSYLQNPSSPKNLVAQGLVEATSSVLKFQGDINGDKTVDYVHYYVSGSAPPYSLHRFAGGIQSADGHHRWVKQAADICPCIATIRCFVKIVVQCAGKTGAVIDKFYTAHVMGSRKLH